MRIVGRPEDSSKGGKHSKQEHKRDEINCFEDTVSLFAQVVDQEGAQAEEIEFCCLEEPEFEFEF